MDHLSFYIYNFLLVDACVKTMKLTSAGLDHSKKIYLMAGIEHEFILKRLNFSLIMFIVKLNNSITHTHK